MYSTALRDCNPPPKIAITITTKITICFVAYLLPSMKISRNPFMPFCANLLVNKQARPLLSGPVSGTLFVSAENEIIRSLSTSYGIILSVISVFLSSLTNVGHIRPISMRYLWIYRTFGLSNLWTIEQPPSIQDTQYMEQARSHN